MFKKSFIVITLCFLTTLDFCASQRNSRDQSCCPCFQRFACLLLLLKLLEPLQHELPPETPLAASELALPIPRSSFDQRIDANPLFKHHKPKKDL